MPRVCVVKRQTILCLDGRPRCLQSHSSLEGCPSKVSPPCPPAQVTACALAGSAKPGVSCGRGGRARGTRLQVLDFPSCVVSYSSREAISEPVDLRAAIQPRTALRSIHFIPVGDPQSPKIILNL